MPQRDANIAPHERHDKTRAAADDPSLKVTITLPKSILMLLDELVLERKRSDRGANRSALILSAIDAYLAGQHARDA